MNQYITALTDSSFDADVLKSTIPVFEETAAEFTGKVTFGKVDVDANSEIPAKFGVRGIPTLILFKDGEAVATKVGALTKSQLIAFINSNI
jgi:thioredoxin 1